MTAQEIRERAVTTTPHPPEADDAIAGSGLPVEAAPGAQAQPAERPR